MTAPPGKEASEEELQTFLLRARRRYLVRDFLVVAGASAVLSLALEYALFFVSRGFDLGWAPFSIGLPLFFVAGVVCLRRNRVGPVAARTDVALGLKDRLTTFLDFRARTDVDAGFRRAQAREAAAALPSRNLARGIRISAPLRAAPLLFAWMLYIDYFPYVIPYTPFVVQQLVPSAVSNRAAPRQRESPAPPEQLPGTEPPAATPPREPSPQTTPPSAHDARTPPGEGTPPEGQPGADDAEMPRAGSVPGMIGEPARLYSEPATKGLTPVGRDATGPAGSPAGELPAAPLRGRISFNLVPADGEGEGPAGSGTTPGGGVSRSLEITVDYDSIPPEYRSHVRRYFSVLVRLFQGGNDGT